MKRSLAAIAAMLLLSSTSWAQLFPTRPIAIVVPFAAGGLTDVIARTLARHMTASLGQSVIVANAAGAHGNIGFGKVAGAAPDGYTLRFADLGQEIFPRDQQTPTALAVTKRQTSKSSGRSSKSLASRPIS